MLDDMKKVREMERKEDRERRDRILEGLAQVICSSCGALYTKRDCKCPRCGHVECEAS